MDEPKDHAAAVDAQSMRRVYEETKTPFKRGIVLRPPVDGVVDCPSVFRFENRWYMMYVQAQNKVGYETLLAASDDLLKWEPLGRILPFRDEGWDKWQADGGIALFDHHWGGNNSLQQFNGKYWLSYLGGELQGYEPDPLSIGIAHTTTPHKAVPWTRLAENPVLGPSQPERNRQVHRRPNRVGRSARDDESRDFRVLLPRVRARLGVHDEESLFPDVLDHAVGRSPNVHALDEPNVEGRGRGRRNHVRSLGAHP